MGRERKSRVDGTVHASMSSPPTKRHRNNSADVNGNAITHSFDNAYPQEIDPSFVANINTNSSLNQSEGIQTHEYPPGYRFCPFESELIIYYLQKKVNNEPMPYNMIKDVNLYNHNPAYLAGHYEVIGYEEWYFFTPRDRKYRNGNRPNRAAGDGYWKATGADKNVKQKHNDVIIGKKKTLVFYLGKPPHGVKTNWIMHEYKVDTPPRIRKDENDMRLDDWVLCKIYEKPADKPKKEFQQDHHPAANKPNKHCQQDQQKTMAYPTTLPEEIAPSANENNLARNYYDQNTCNGYDGLLQIHVTPSYPNPYISNVNNIGGYFPHEPFVDCTVQSSVRVIRYPIVNATQSSLRSKDAEDDFGNLSTTDNVLAPQNDSLDGFLNLYDDIYPNNYPPNYQ